jgi:hypothetical protein
MAKRRVQYAVQIQDGPDNYVTYAVARSPREAKELKDRFEQLGHTVKIKEEREAK